MDNFIANPRSTKDIRNLADVFRTTFGFDKKGKERFPIMEFIEFAMPRLDKQFHIEILEKEVLKNIHGLACPNEHCIQIRKDVYERAINGEGRDRFTIAHEIGHYFMHGQDNVRLARLGELKTVQAYRDPEWQANTFAAELLMPIYLIDKEDSCFEIAEKFGVSLSAAEIRLKKIYKQ